MDFSFNWSCDSLLKLLQYSFMNPKGLFRFMNSCLHQSISLSNIIKDGTCVIQPMINECYGFLLTLYKKGNMPACGPFIHNISTVSICQILLLALPSGTGGITDCLHLFSTQITSVFLLECFLNILFSPLKFGALSRVRLNIGFISLMLPASQWDPSFCELNTFSSLESFLQTQLWWLILPLFILISVHVAVVWTLLIFRFSSSLSSSSPPALYPRHPP